MHVPTELVGRIVVGSAQSRAMERHDTWHLGYHLSPNVKAISRLVPYGPLKPTGLLTQTALLNRERESGGPTKAERRSHMISGELSRLEASP